MNIARRPANGGVRVVNLNQIQPGTFGTVRTQQVDPSLPLAPQSSDELRDMIATRNAVFSKPGGYAELPMRLTPQQQVNLNAKLGESLGGMDTKYYLAPGGGQGMAFSKPKTPFVDNSVPVDELGQVAFKTDYGEMPILLDRSKAPVMMGNYYPTFDLKGRDIKQSDMMSTRQMLGALNASNASERIELTDRLQRGGFDVSTSNQMAELNPQIQGGTWTGADIAEFEPLGASGMMQRVDSPDALFPTWKQTPSQSSQMQQGDILRGQQGATDVRDLAPAMNPLYTVNRPGMKIVNTEYLSSTPNRVIPFQQKTWEMVNADGSITPIYKTVKGNSEVANALMQKGLARPVEQVPMLAPGEIYSTDRETVAVPPAFQAPEPLPSRGGYDITTESDTRQFPDKTWANTNLEVMLPSTVLTDKKLSPYLLTQNSQIPTKELGRQRYSDDVYYDRMEAERMVDTNPYADYVTEKGGQFYEPMQDAQSVVDRLGQAQKRANIPYVSDRNRVQTSSPNMNIQSQVMGQSIMKDGNLPTDQQEAMDRALNGGMTIGRQPTDSQLSSLVNRYAPVREYDRRVNMANDAINEGYQKLGTMPDVEPTRITTMVPSSNGYDQMVETADMSVAQRLAESRDFQQRGYGQATMGLPQGVTVGVENVNSLLVFPNNKQMTSDTGVNRVNKNGSLQEVYPLGDRQRAQFQSEIAAGQRQVMPVGTTQPGISMANELLEEGVPLGRALNLPVTRLNMTTKEAGDYTAPFVQERFAVEDSERMNSAGMRVRSEERGVTQSALAETEMMKRRDAMLQKKFGGDWQKYVIS